jgi:hypothetical protein
MNWGYTVEIEDVILERLSEFRVSDIKRSYDQRRKVPCRHIVRKRHMEMYYRTLGYQLLDESKNIG